MQESNSVRQIWEAEARIEDTWAGVYDSVYDTWQPCYRAYKDSVANLVHSCWMERPGPVLEVGCGTGTVLERLAQRIPERLLGGVDIAPEMIARAAQKVRGGAFQVCPFEKFRPEAGHEKFEVIYFSGSLHHMPDQALVAAKLDELTGPGARVVVCEPNEDWIYQSVWRNRLRRLASPTWLWLRVRNRADIRRINGAVGPLAEPAFHQHVEAASVEQVLAGRFGLRTRRTDFAYTRLFEGVVTSASDGTIRWLRGKDAELARTHPSGGGAVEMVFVKP